MASIKSRPTMGPTNANLSGVTAWALLSDITATTIWGDATLQYVVGIGARLTWDTDFQAFYDEAYTGAADTNHAYSTRILSAYRALDAVMGIDLTNVTAVGTVTGVDLVTITSANDDPPGSLEGRHQFPGSSGHPDGGYWSLGIFTSDVAVMNVAAELGGGSYLGWTLLHELGHGFGIKHTHQEAAGTPPLATVGAAMDNERYSVMSYNGASTGEAYGHAVTPMALDIAALQALYGTDAYAATSSTYSLTNPGSAALILTEGDVQIGRAYYAIWDSGGADTIDYTSTGRSVLINLNSATLNTTSTPVDIADIIAALQNTDGFSRLSSELRLEITDRWHHAGGFFSRVLETTGTGTSARYTGVDGGYSIAFGATIENGTGGDREDFLIGNAVGNTLRGNAGNDTFVGGGGSDGIVGGAGVDVASFTEARGNYTITRNTDGSYSISHTGGSRRDGVDRLTGVEFAQFDDVRVALSQCPPIETDQPVDFIFLQDLTGSFSDDLPIVRAGLDEMLNGIYAFLDNVVTGAAAFRDQGDDFIYQVRAPASASPSGVLSAYAGMVADAGGDLPEAQLTALMEASGGAGLALRAGAQRVFMVVTDASYHPYVEIETLRAALEAANAQVIFAVTPGNEATYEQLVGEIGCGTVVTITSTSVNLADVVREGLSVLAGDVSTRGTTSGDVMDGTTGADRIFARLGRDTIEGFDSGDFLDGGGDADKIGGGNGGDDIWTGTGDDTAFGDSGSDTLRGGGGNDVMFGDDVSDLATYVSGSGVISPSNTIAVPTAVAPTESAIVIDPTTFSLALDANIANSQAFPHGTISLVSDGTMSYFALSARAGERYIFDIDLTPSGSDLYLTIRSSTGVSVGSDDDSSTLEGGGGSTNGRDPFLDHTFSADGVYFISVASYPGNTSLPAGTAFTLHVSQVPATAGLTRAASTAPGADLLLGDDGNDSLWGGSGIDTLYGGDGQDYLHGGVGGDLMDGGVDNDTFVVDSSADRLVERVNEGIDTVEAFINFTLRPNFENLTLRGTAAVGVGNALNNVIFGNAVANRLYGDAGSDRMDGAGGADVMYGGTGDDRYTFDNAADAAIENLNEGIDTVISSVSYTLRPNLENLILAGAAVVGVGNALANTMIGNGMGNVLDAGDGNDTMDGDAGADTMRGGDGNDRYTFDVATDRAIELAGDGIDTVISSVSYQLRDHVENLTLVGGAVNAVGNSAANVLVGNALGNLIAGKQGNDILRGGAGADVFLFDTALSASTNVDRIADFVAPDDTIRLSSAVFGGIAPGVLAAANFRLGTSAGDASDRIVYDPATGRLFYDADGLGGAAQTLFAVLDTKPLNVTAADFTIV